MESWPVVMEKKLRVENMKKTLLLILSFLVIFAFVSCNGETPNPDIPSDAPVVDSGDYFADMTATDKAAFVALRSNYLGAVFGDPEVADIMKDNEAVSGSNKAGTLTITRNLKDDGTGDVKFEFNGYEVTSLSEVPGLGAAKLYGTFTVSGNMNAGMANASISCDVRIDETGVGVYELTASYAGGKGSIQLNGEELQMPENIG